MKGICVLTCLLVDLVFFFVSVFLLVDLVAACCQLN